MPDKITEPQVENGNVLKYRLELIEKDFKEFKERYEKKHEEMIDEFEKKIEDQDKTIHLQSIEITSLKERLTAMQFFQAGFSTVAGTIAIIVAKLIGG